MKFDANYFDEEFYRGKSKGAIRSADSPFYHFFSSRVATCIDKLGISRENRRNFTMLDVGGGVGWEAKHYIAQHAFVSTSVADVSLWANQNHVLKEEEKLLKRQIHFCVDVRKLKTVFGEESFDLVIANRILAYLPKNSAHKALGQLVNVSRKHLLCAVICSDHKGASVREWAKGSGRLNIEPRVHWKERFKKLGLKVNKNLTSIMRSGGWDCIWWLEKE